MCSCFKIKKRARTGTLRYHSWSEPLADKDEWLFLATASSFASSTRGMVSPSAGELCGTLGTENREIATRKSDSKKVWERDGKRRSKTVKGRMGSASTKTKKNKRIVLYPIILSARILCTYTLGCLCEPSSGDYMYVSQCIHTKRRQKRRVCWLRMWGSSSAGKYKWNIDMLTASHFFICVEIVGTVSTVKCETVASVTCDMEVWYPAD